MQLTRYWLFCR